MSYEDSIPKDVPEKGFYYHYKHDPAGAVNNYAYEFMGVGHHTEDDCRPEDALLAVYRPLYEAFVYKNGRMFDVRPLSMFMESVTKEGKTFPRFQKITDPLVIAELEQVRKEMYSE
jgi:hypothetical protein